MWTAVLKDKKFEGGKLTFTVEYKNGENVFQDVLTIYDPPEDGVDAYLSKITTEKLENLEKLQEVMSTPNEEKEIPRFKKSEEKVGRPNQPVDNQPTQ